MRPRRLPESLVDIHCHILPRVDDGPRSDDEALAMLRLAAAEGVGTIVSTPHADRITRQEIPGQVERINALASEAGLAIRVLNGSEVRLTVDTVERYAAGFYATLNQTPYLLVELPLNAPWPRNLADVIGALRLVGAIPVLAHAERYRDVQERPGRLISVANADVVIQVNASSLAPQAPSVLRRTADYLIRSHLAHVIASDAHDSSRRPPGLRRALTAIATRAGDEYAGWMIQASRAIIGGEPIQLPEPLDLEPHRGVWSRLRYRD